MPDLSQLIGGGILLTLVGLLCLQMYAFRAKLAEVRVRLADVEAEVADIKMRCREHHGKISSDFSAIYDTLRLMAREHETRHVELITALGEVKADVRGALGQFAEHTRNGHRD